MIYDISLFNLYTVIMYNNFVVKIFILLFTLKCFIFFVIAMQKYKLKYVK